MVELPWQRKRRPPESIRELLHGVTLLSAADRSIERIFYSVPIMARAAYLEERCKSALNRVAKGGPLPYAWTINPYRGYAHECHYCFARAYHSYLDLGIGEDFARRIVVKTNVAEVLRHELGARRWQGEPVAMGTATDPYQPCEGRYRLTRKVLRALIEFHTPLSMLTKSTLIVRDIDLISELGSTAGATIAMSVGSLDESVRRLVEPGTPPVRSRLSALSRVASAGIPTGVLVAPIPAVSHRCPGHTGRAGGVLCRGRSQPRDGRCSAHPSRHPCPLLALARTGTTGDLRRVSPALWRKIARAQGISGDGRRAARACVRTHGTQGQPGASDAAPAAPAPASSSRWPFEPETGQMSLDRPVLVPRSRDSSGTGVRQNGGGRKPPVKVGL